MVSQYEILNDETKYTRVVKTNYTKEYMGD